MITHDVPLKQFRFRAGTKPFLAPLRVVHRIGDASVSAAPLAVPTSCSRQNSGTDNTKAQMPIRIVGALLLR
ncbi:hypothetical protein ACYULU_06465 [Breznakiellaceae bacterium SP9]